jgi:TatD DNase family protein
LTAAAGPRLVDIGANLTHASFASDRPAVIERAAAVGVDRLIVTGTSVQGSAAAIGLANTHPGTLWATAGVHPHDAAHFGPTTVTELRELAGDIRVVAIGECGLDYFRGYAPPEAQLPAFRAQVRLAAELGLPLFLHQRAAHADFLRVLHTEIAAPIRGVAHCYTEGPEAMRDYLDLGLHIGITGWICDERRGEDLRRAVIDLPSDRLLLETDAPYLLPRNLRPTPRGRRNEPAFLTAVCAMVASCTGRSAEEVAAASSRNAERLFSLDATAR